MEGLTPARKRLLSMLAAVLFGADVPCAPAPPDDVMREAVRQGVFLLSARGADPGLISDDTLRQDIRYMIQHSVARVLTVSRAHAEAGALLESNGVPHTFIKGLVTSEWYPEPDMRILGDVDFYVDPGDVARTEELLLANGYKPEKLSHNIHHVFVKDNARYELHFGIPGMPEGKAGERCRKYLDGLISESELRLTDFGPVRMPSAFHHGLILILHTAHHLTNSGAGLRQLCDWAVYAGGIADDPELSGRLYAALEDIGLKRFAACLNRISADHLGCPVSDAMPVEQDAGLCGELLRDIFAGGNFGQGDDSRSREAYLITAGHGGGSRAKRLAVTLTEMVNQKWPLTRRVKPLVPVGLAYYAAVYFCRAVVGRKPKLKALDAVRGAEARNDLYAELQLFNISE